MSAPRALSYGDGLDHAADLWLPDGEPRAVVVTLHGGYFRATYDRSLHDPTSAALAARGLAVWNVEYRRAGAGGGFAATTADVRAAIDALAALPDTAAVAGLPVAVHGHSAGGYLACSAAAHPAVSLVVSAAGIADPRRAVTEGWDNGAVAAWMGGSPAELPELYDAADLAARAPTGTPHVLVHGTADDTVPVGESRRLAAALAAAGDVAELHELPGEGHYGFLDPADPASVLVADRLVAWAAAL